MRSLWRRAPEPLLRLALGSRGVRVNRLLDSALVTVNRTVDGAALAEDRHGPFVGHVEFETDARPDCLRRIALYGLLLHERHGLPVRSALLVLEPATGLGDGLRMVHGPRELCRYHVDILRIYELPSERLAQHPTLAVLAPLGRDASESTVRSARARIQRAPTEERTDLLASLYILSGRRFGFDLITRLFNREELMESVTYRAILEEGIEKGIEKGIERGIERGIWQGVGKVLRRQIALRFPDQAASLEPLIDRCSPDDLDAAVDVLLRAASADELRAFLEARLAH